ncbi:MAG: DUF3604 domain-containing protein [Desulfobacterales bacterium]|nr:DUF3604 domain-containing protein [Desulfobacterales bacterium]
MAKGIIKNTGMIFIAILVGLFVFLYAATEGYLGDHLGPGQVTDRTIPAQLLTERLQTQSGAAEGVGAVKSKQILFGDLHVHTTFSADAFVNSLPIVQGEGAHPPADACDYARFCSALDFWSINDHAVSVSPKRWIETKESIRHCNSVTDPANPDVLAFLGYEWTHADSASAATHYGHKNVIFRELDEDKVPARPIYAVTEMGPAQFNPRFVQRFFLPITEYPNSRIYLNHNRFAREILSVEKCPEGINTLELSVNCREGAADPATLFTKLDEGGYESIVIPHGNTWGAYTPAGTTWDKQLEDAMHDPERQILMESYSGHGNSEEYRDWRAVIYNEKGEPECPPKTPDYLPTCRRAGEIIKERCLGIGESESECKKREFEAQQYFLATMFGQSTVPGATLTDWLDSGQCKDCFLPAFNYRPGGSAQYALAISNFDDPENIKRFRFGLMASSDNHTARPGTGYKEIDRRENTEASGVRDQELLDLIAGKPEPLPYAQPISPEERDPRYMLPRAERAMNYFLTGGLIAVHAEGRDRSALWNAMKRKEVYGTSGDRILLWFDLLNGPGAIGEDKVLPMGSEVKMSAAPKFRVRAVGAFKQKPGCPEYSVNALSPERLNHLCRSECYNPSDERKRITRIEVIRIRPQTYKGEDVGGLIEDVWLSHSCVPDLSGCSFEFEDPEFQSAARDTVYYVRAIEEPSDTVNAGFYRCDYDGEGNCIKTNPCYGDFRTDYEDDCLEKSEERAWSSPIFIDYPKTGI